MARRDWNNFYSHAPRYVLLDRDGVINRRIPGGYVTRWEDFEFLPRALDALWLLAQNGYTGLVISNQACVGKGQLSSRELDLLTHRFLLEVALSGGRIEQVYYCRHKPEERCSCRKPNAGLLLRARMDYHFLPEETYFIGDSDSDVAAARAAGCGSILIRRGAFLERWDEEKNPTLMASSLYEAAEMVLRPTQAVSDQRGVWLGENGQSLDLDSLRLATTGSSRRKSQPGTSGTRSWWRDHP